MHICVAFVNIYTKKEIGVSDYIALKPNLKKQRKKGKKAVRLHFENVHIVRTGVLSIVLLLLPPLSLLSFNQGYYFNPYRYFRSHEYLRS